MKSNIVHLPVQPGTVRFLLPSGMSLQRGNHGMLRCEVHGESLYDGVKALRLFPISYGDRFISLRYTDGADKEQEIGIIEDLDGFSKKDSELILTCLRGHYFERIITRILRIRHEFGQLFFKVLTEDGEVDFVMPWRQDRAEEYGSQGKVLFDALNNRYLIPNIEALPSAERQKLLTYIYW